MAHTEHRRRLLQRKGSLGPDPCKKTGYSAQLPLTLQVTRNRIYTWRNYQKHSEWKLSHNKVTYSLWWRYTCTAIMRFLISMEPVHVPLSPRIMWSEHTRKKQYIVYHFNIVIKYFGFYCGATTIKAYLRQTRNTIWLVLLIPAPAMADYLQKSPSRTVPSSVESKI